MAGEAEVKLKFIADEKALATAEKRLDSLTAKLNALDKAVSKPRSKPKDDDAFSMDQAIGGMARYVTAAALAAAAVKLITNEWNNVIERQSKAGQVAITFEEALGEATLNVGAIMSPDKLKARALKMSAETGVSPATAVQAISLSIKSGGAANEDEAARLADAAVVAGKLSPRAAADKLADTSGSIASYMSRTGATAEQAGGVLLSMQSRSNIADPNKAMAAAGPTLANMLAQGASEGMAQAMMPALSQAIEDTQGDTSSLAATTFSKSLADAGAVLFKGQKNIPDKMLAAIQNDPELSRRFFSGEIEDSSGKSLGKPEMGKGKAETFFRSLGKDPSLEGNERIKQSYIDQYEAFRTQAVTGDEAGKFYSERLDQVRGATPTLQQDRIFKSGIESSRIENTRDAAAGVARENLRELMQASGMSDTSRKFVMADFDVAVGGGRDPVTAAIDSIRHQAANQRGQSEAGYGSINPFELMGVLKDELLGVSEERKRDSDNLEKIANRLERSRNRNGNVEPVGAN